MRLLTDINGLIYRSFFKLHLTSNKGREVGGAFGALKALGSIAEKISPDEMIICWDSGYSRKSSIYPEYKANRRRDETLVANIQYQRSILRKLFSFLPIIQIEEKDCEADDVIAVLTRFLHLEKVGIVTNDHDLYFLSSENCKILSLNGDEVQLNENPQNFLTRKILVGDPSDNVKGIERIGKVTADRLISEYGSLEKILKHVKTANSLGSIRFQEAEQIISRNKKLLTPGSLLTAQETNNILNSYKQFRLTRKLDKSGFTKELMSLGFTSIVSRLTGWLVPFKSQERVPRNGKSDNQDRDKSNAKNRNAAVAGGDKTISDLRKKQTPSVATTGNRQRSGGALQHANDQSRSSRTESCSSRNSNKEKVLSKHRGEKLPSWLMSFEELRKNGIAIIRNKISRRRY